MAIHHRASCFLHSITSWFILTGELPLLLPPLPALVNVAMNPSYVVIGTPFSTFTRAVTSALNFKEIPFEQKATLPHSELARKHHPFGFIPSLVITEVRMICVASTSISLLI